MGLLIVERVVKGSTAIIIEQRSVVHDQGIPS